MVNRKMSENSDIVKMWNSYFVLDPINTAQLRRKWLLNPYLERIRPYIREGAYSLLVARKRPFHHEPINYGRSWIMSAGLSSLKALELLIQEQISISEKGGFKEVLYSNVTPEYFYPGIDSKHYPEIFDILTDNGFVIAEEAISMEIDLGDRKYAGVHDYESSISDLSKKEFSKFLSFLARNYDGDIYQRAYDVIRKGDPYQITVAKVDDEFAGYAMFSTGEGSFWYSPGGRFGPFEVLEKFRSKGIGSKLLSRTLDKMKEYGLRHAFFMWGNEKAAHLYSRFGFKETRRFEIMKLLL